MITDNVTGEVVCGSCGLVLIEKSEDPSPESTGHDLEGYLTKSRTGAGLSLTMHDKGLFTVIDHKNKDAAGNSLSGYMKNTFDRLRIWDSRSISKSTNRSLRQACYNLDALTTKLAIPYMVAEKAAYIYRKAVSAKLTRGRNSASMICASLYAACRESDTPRTLNDIARTGNISRKNISRSYMILARNLDLKLPSYDSSEFITRISNEVGISEKTRRDALKILSKVVKKEMSSGKNPMGLAASAIYLSCIINNEKQSQTKLAKAAGVTPVTIRNRISSIRKGLDEEELIRN